MNIAEPPPSAPRESRQQRESRLGPRFAIAFGTGGAGDSGISLGQGSEKRLPRVLAYDRLTTVNDNGAVHDYELDSR